MSTKTEAVMKRVELQVLEQQLVAKAQEIAALSGAPSFLIPFIAKNGRKQFITVGPYNAIPGLLAQARKM
jgi:hypothetical protein